MQALLAILARMGMALLTEALLKKVAIIGLEAVAKRTENTEDDKLVAAVKEAWEK